MLPKDPIILLSTVNTRLRDFHNTLEDFCLSHDCDMKELTDTLAKVDYYYDKDSNQFK